MRHNLLLAALTAASFLSVPRPAEAGCLDEISFWGVVLDSSTRGPVAGACVYPSSCSCFPDDMCFCSESDTGGTFSLPWECYTDSASPESTILFSVTIRASGYRDTVVDIGMLLIFPCPYRDLQTYYHVELPPILLSPLPADVAEVPASEAPAEYQLCQNAPNPFNAATTINYSLAAERPVRLEVFDLLGQRVAVLIDEVQPAGSHTVVWDATDSRGQPVSSGLYLYRMTVADRQETRKMVVLK